MFEWWKRRHDAENLFEHEQAEASIRTLRMLSSSTWHLHPQTVEQMQFMHQLKNEIRSLEREKFHLFRKMSRGAQAEIIQKKLSEESSKG